MGTCASEEKKASVIQAFDNYESEDKKTPASVENCVTDEEKTTAAPSQLLCCICLAVIDPRGGIPFMSPGCCGVLYHQDCMSQLLKKSGQKCPACRTLLPAASLNDSSSRRAVASPPPLPAPARIRRPSPSMNRSMRQNSISNLGERRESGPICLLNDEEDVVASEGCQRPVNVPNGDADLKLHCFPELYVLSYARDGVLTVSLCVSDTISPLGEESFRVVVTLEAELPPAPNAAPASSRALPLDVICVLDKSGSMGADNKLGNLLHAGMSEM